MLGREAATLLSTGFWAWNHSALEHIDFVIGRDSSGVPLSSSPIIIDTVRLQLRTITGLVSGHSRHPIILESSSDHRILRSFSLPVLSKLTWGSTFLRLHALQIQGVIGSVRDRAPKEGHSYHPPPHLRSPPHPPSPPHSFPPHPSPPTGCKNSNEEVSENVGYINAIICLLSCTKLRLIICLNIFFVIVIIL